MTEVQTGRPPSTSAELWESAAKSLGPDKSLERIETHAKYLFSTVAVFGTLLTGFGLLSVGETVNVDPRVLIAPLAVVCLSLALAMYAMTPSAGRVNANDLMQVRAYFQSRLLRRGSAIFAAGLLFAVALLLVVPVAIRGTPAERPSSTLELEYARGEKGDELAATILIRNLPRNVTVVVTAFATGAAGETPVFSQRASRPDGGEIKLEFRVPGAPSVRQLRVVVNATLGQKKLLEDSSTLVVRR